MYVRPDAIVVGNPARKIGGRFQRRAGRRRRCGSSGGTGQRARQGSVSTAPLSCTSCLRRRSSTPGRRDALLEAPLGARHRQLQRRAGLPPSAASLALARRDWSETQQIVAATMLEGTLLRRPPRARHHPLRLRARPRTYGSRCGCAYCEQQATSTPWRRVHTPTRTPAPHCLGGAHLAGAGDGAHMGAGACCQRGERPASRSAGAPVRAGLATPTSCCATARWRRSPPSLRGLRRAGGAPVFRGDVFDALGGYEERFFLYDEDVNLAFRAVLAGYHALLVPSAGHPRLGATTRSHARARFYVARNSVWCAVRCLPGARPRGLARRWVLELRTNRPRRLAPVEVAGRLAGFAGLPRALRGAARSRPGGCFGRLRRRASARARCARGRPVARGVAPAPAQRRQIANPGPPGSVHRTQGSVHLPLSMHRMLVACRDFVTDKGDEH